MKDHISLVLEKVPNQEKAHELIGRLFDVAKPGAVFSEPVTEGEYTVITAAELHVGMGAGFGGGGGAASDPDDAEGDEESGIGYGGGGGGGGTATSRPVAAIIIGPNGVRVEPIVDPTKIAVAFFTMLITLLFSRKSARSKDG